VNNTCPSCNTPYNVGAGDVGRRFTCFQCNASLEVQKSGIVVAGAASGDNLPEPIPVSGPGPGPALRPKTRALPRPNALPDVSTGLFGAGLFLVVLFLFLPILDQAKATRLKAGVKVGDLREERLDKELKEKKGPTPQDEDLRKRTKETWTKEKERLQIEAAEAEFAAQQSGYWYTWGMFLGFLLLAFGGMAWLDPRQPLIRRIVGAIVVVAEALLIFAKYVAKV
jgi:hypothetical protein